MTTSYNGHRTGKVAWLMTLAFVVGVLFGLIASAVSDSLNQSFRVGLQLVPANARPLTAPAINLPARATTIAVQGATSYHVSSMSLAEATDYFRGSMPVGGYAVVNESSAGDRWQSLWRRTGDSTCVQIDAQTVVGTDVVRLKTESVYCQ